MIYQVWKNDSRMPRIRKIMQLSCWPLRRMDGTKVIGSASASVGRIHGKRVLLTTYHSIAKSGEWKIELEFDKKAKKSILRGFSSFNFIKKIIYQTGELTQTDVAYSFIEDDYYSKLQYITKFGDIIKSIQRIESDYEIGIDPNSIQHYGFYGQIQPSKDENLLMLKHIVHSGLTFLRKDDEYIVFDFPNTLGDDYVHGCSGAPIIGDDGKTYGIVCFGKANKNELYCISIKQISAVIQAAALDHVSTFEEKLHDPIP